MPLLQTKPHPDGLLQVLDMGCGTSALGPCIYRHSPLPVRVTCADISPIAVRIMQEHVQTKAIQPHNLSSWLEFVELDCTQLHKHYGCSSVDLIVGKGTTDALLRSKEGKWKGQSGAEAVFEGVAELREVGERRGMTSHCYQVTPRSIV
ncbi:hypothetical protein VZT92_024883 [Zoarces viviparus]|uniref:Methyltransferase domain-containing protein n=1 Tax=Zoarces viviparus TaxID=48416 RepID=A0AAW1E3X0_ZOAVI